MICQAASRIRFSAVLFFSKSSRASTKGGELALSGSRAAADRVSHELGEGEWGKRDGQVLLRASGTRSQRAVLFRCWTGAIPLGAFLRACRVTGIHMGASPQQGCWL